MHVFLPVFWLCSEGVCLRLIKKAWEKTKLKKLISKQPGSFLSWLTQNQVYKALSQAMIFTDALLLEQLLFNSQHLLS